MMQYTVIGLNQIGVSLGMALASRKEELIVVGLDRDTKLAHSVEKLKAFYQIVYNLRGAVEKADVVFICVPFDEIKETLEAIKDLLKPGAIVIDMSILKKPGGEWAEQILPEKNPYLGIFPTMKSEYEHLPRLDPKSGRADLFEGRILFLATGEKTSQKALQFGMDLCEKLGCKWMFIDREESDGCFTAFELLGQVMAAAVYGIARNQIGNMDGLKMAGATFASLGEILCNIDEREYIGRSWSVARPVLEQYLDLASAEMARIRSLLVPEHAKELESYLKENLQFKAEWEKHHSTGTWEKFTNEPVRSPGRVLGKLVQFGMFNKDKNKRD
jgi:prephenate dehydrogenase